MRKLLIPTLSFGFLLCTIGQSVADDAELTARLKKGVDALGGAANLTKFPAATWDGKGTFNFQGNEMEFTGKWAIDGLTKSRTEFTMDFMGTDFEMIFVINGDQAWTSQLGNVGEMPEEQMEATKLQQHAMDIGALMPFARGDKSYKVAPLGDSDVRGKKVVGIKVSKAGMNDVKLFLDKETNIPLKIQFTSIDPMQGGDVERDALFLDYKDVMGIKQPMKLIFLQDGEEYITTNISNFKLHKKLDDSMFQEP